MDEGVVPLMPPTLYDFYFRLDSQTTSIDKDFTNILTFHYDDTITPIDSTNLSQPTFAYTSIHYEDTSEFDFDTLPWAPQRGPNYI